VPSPAFKRPPTQQSLPPSSGRRRTPFVAEQRDGLGWLPCRSTIPPKASVAPPLVAPQKSGAPCSFRVEPNHLILPGRSATTSRTRPFLTMAPGASLSGWWRRWNRNTDHSSGCSSLRRLPPVDQIERPVSPSRPTFASTIQQSPASGFRAAPVVINPALYQLRSSPAASRPRAWRSGKRRT